MCHTHCTGEEVDPLKSIMKSSKITQLLGVQPTPRHFSMKVLVGPRGRFHKPLSSMRTGPTPHSLPSTCYVVGALFIVVEGANEAVSASLSILFLLAQTSSRSSVCLCAWPSSPACVPRRLEPRPMTRESLGPGPWPGPEQVLGN